MSRATIRIPGVTGGRLAILPTITSLVLTCDGELRKNLSAAADLVNAKLRCMNFDRGTWRLRMSKCYPGPRL